MLVKGKGDPQKFQGILGETAPFYKWVLVWVERVPKHRT